jgi:RNA polymerase sigma factor (sigma-70 family)
MNDPRSAFASTVEGDAERALCDPAIVASDPMRARLYACFYPRLTAYARRLVDASLAEDIVQEVFLRVLKYKDGEVERLPIQFLLTMTRNVALRVLASKRRECGAVPETMESMESAPRVEMRLAHPSVPDLLERLPERQREALTLTTGRGLSEQQASLAMNASRSAVSQRRRSAIEHLRRFTAEGFDERGAREDIENRLFVRAPEARGRTA